MRLYSYRFRSTGCCSTRLYRGRCCPLDDLSVHVAKVDVAVADVAVVDVAVVDVAVVAVLVVVVAVLVAVVVVEKVDNKESGSNSR